ncbi:hypothetical protein JVU11DRAFT_2816 [Chiua virens]|nr:hypothetical protein JVU11DRAFT_2816 [Chiua virens]
MPSHPRRLFLVILAIPVLFLVFLYLAGTHRPISNFFTTSPSTKLPDEIFGLLHFVTSPDESARVVRAPGDPDTAMDGKLGVGGLRDPRP